MTSLKWSAWGKVVTQVFSWLSTFIVIRILTPNDYGIIEICIAFTTFSFFICEGGLADSLVYYKNKDPDYLRSTFTAAITFGALFYLCLFLASPFIGDFYASEDIANALKVLGLLLLISAFSVVPNGLLRQQMNFKKIALAEGAAGLCNAITTLSCALSGLGFWSLIFGNLVNELVKAILLNFFVGQVYFKFRSIRLLSSTWKYSANIVINRMLWLTYTKFDVVAIGRVLGTAALGLYSVALQIATLPMEKVAAIMNHISFAAYSKVQDDLESVRYYFLMSSKLLAFISFPIFLGIALVGAELIELVLGDKWIEAAAPMAVLCFIVPFRIQTIGIQAMLQGIGKPKVNTKILGVSCITVSAGILIGLNWGIIGACLGWLFGFLISYVIAVYRVSNILDFDGWSYFKLIVQPFIWSLVMYYSVEFLSSNYLSESSTLTIFSLEIFAGAFLFVLLAVTFGWQSYCKELIRMVKKTK